MVCLVGRMTPCLSEGPRQFISSIPFFAWPALGEFGHLLFPSELAVPSLKKAAGPVLDSLGLTLAGRSLAFVEGGGGNRHSQRPVVHTCLCTLLSKAATDPDQALPCPSATRGAVSPGSTLPPPQGSASARSPSCKGEGQPGLSQGLLIRLQAEFFALGSRC